MPDPRNRLKLNATCKVYPAVGDLQAISDVWQFYDYTVTPSSGGFNIYTGVVPAGKMAVVAYIWSANGDASSALIHSLNEAADVKVYLNSITTTAIWQSLVTRGVIVLDEGQKIRFAHNNVASSIGLISSLSGYLVDKY